MFWFITYFSIVFAFIAAYAIVIAKSPVAESRTYCNIHSDYSPRDADCVKDSRTGCGYIAKKRIPDFAQFLFSGALILMIVLGVVLLIASATYTSEAYNASNNVSNSYYIIEEKTSQRDALLAEFDDILSNEDFIALMNASVPEDIVFLKTNPQVSEFLISRADRIVSVNASLFNARDKILDESKFVCNRVQNPFVPHLPFMSPECQLGQVLQVTDQPSLER